jgi:hypothetical protein
MWRNHGKAARSWKCIKARPRSTPDCLQPHRLSNTTNGSLRTWALQLGMKDAKLLMTTLDEEQATEIALTATATKVVNQTAESGLTQTPARLDPFIEPGKGSGLKLGVGTGTLAKLPG